MSKDEIISNLKEIVTPYVQNDQEFKNFSENTDFLKDLEINSAHLVDIILDVEEAFNITIENEAMDNMLTVKDAVGIIESKSAQA